MDNQELDELAVRRAMWLASLDVALVEAQGATRALSRSAMTKNDADELLASLRAVRREIEELRGAGRPHPNFPPIWF